jgi:hypothetical protein
MRCSRENKTDEQSFPRKTLAHLFSPRRPSPPERVSERGGRRGDRSEERRRHASARRRATLTLARCRRAVALRHPNSGARAGQP